MTAISGSGLSKKRPFDSDIPNEIPRKLLKTNNGSSSDVTDQHILPWRISGLCQMLVSLSDPRTGFIVAYLFHPEKGYDIFCRALKNYTVMDLSCLSQLKDIHSEMYQRKLTSFQICTQYLDMLTTPTHIPKLREFAFDLLDTKTIRDFAANIDGLRLVQAHLGVREQAAAVTGDQAVLQFYQGIRCEFGLGAAKSDTAARAHFKNAAEGGNVTGNSSGEEYAITRLSPAMPIIGTIWLLSKCMQKRLLLYKCFKMHNLIFEDSVRRLCNQKNFS